jgi:uncharacterized protein CbrC (UPF0167 family)
MPFPLFEARIEDSSHFVRSGRCSLCGRGPQGCFELGIGCAIMRECPACRTTNGLDASDAESVACRSCGHTVPFPDLPDEIVACHSCLRQGLAAITKDTELGMVSWDQAFEGVTNGVPGLTRSDFELVPQEEEGWVAVRLPPEMMFELLRTPTYSTIQGDRWLFCCKRPMAFVGQWSREDFKTHAPDGNGHTFFSTIVEDSVPGLWEGALHDDAGIYVFRCPTCERLRAHWDLA